MRQSSFFILFCWLISIIGLQSCKTVTPVVETHNRDSVELSNRDSIHSNYHYHQDSTYVDRWHSKETKGDTVYIHDSVNVYVKVVDEVQEATKVKETDTVTVVQNDSTTVFVPVEKELSGIQTAAMNSGYISWGLLLAAIAFGLYKLLRR